MLTLKNARVLPELGTMPSGEYADITIENGRIADITAAGTSAGAGIDLRGKTLLPGFIDAHVHLDLLGTDVWEENTRSDALRVLHCLARARATMQAGFTTLRDLGDRNNIVIALAKAIDDGHVAGPDIIPSGMILTPTESGNSYFEGMYLEADGAEEIVKATRRQIQAGAKWVKYMGTGAYMNPGGEPGAPIYTQDEVTAMVRTAAMHKIPVAGHNHGEIGILTAIRAGVRTVEHATAMNREIMELVKNSGTTYLVPTLAPGAGWAKTGSDSVPDFYRTASKKKMSEGAYERYYSAYEMGLKLGFGTDAGVYADSHGDNAIEFLARVHGVGMKPIDVLRQATRINAEILMLDNEIGTIEVGKKANLVVVDGRPDQTIDDIKKVDMVVKGGIIVKGCD